MFVNDLEGFYRLIKNVYGEEKADLFVELIAERITQETSRFKDYIEVYSKGFEQAINQRDIYMRKSGLFLDYLDSDDIGAAEVLNYKIYKDYDNPNYNVSLRRNPVNVYEHDFVGEIYD